MESNVLCSIKQSPQQVLYNLYYATALVELKGYTMVQFSFFLLRLYGKGFPYTSKGSTDLTLNDCRELYR